jgi:deoxyribodipyrimidine photo-lyase
MTGIHWFRRDLRINDNPAFNEACKSGEVLPIVLIDPNLWPTWGAPKQAYLIDSLKSLNDSLNGNLVIKHGSAVEVIPQIAKKFKVNSVHYAADFSEHGIHRDGEIKKILEGVGIKFEATGSGYAVAPGRVTKDDGTYYKVYTPFYKTWLKHGWRAPAKAPKTLPNFIGGEISDGLPERPDVSSLVIPPAGEQASLDRWKWFKKNALSTYSDDRNRPDLDGTSKLSTALKWGEIHPRTLLAELNDSPGHETFRKELAWREFYADILFNRQDTVEGYFNPLYAKMKYDTGAKADLKFKAWAEGKTGYPFVDAGMRQLLAEGWMHNRVRMVVASFLVKDLHIEWQHGARHFMKLLLDGDYASNSHGWQWTAGCGTDASPYYRVFNPIGQGQKFDPHGDYIRKYIPELGHIQDGTIHEPWKVLGGLDHGYPEPIVDHSIERLEALDRLAKLPKAAK